MATAFFIAGLVVTVVGVALVVVPSLRPKQPEGAGPELDSLKDVKAIMEEFNKLLGQVEQRFRIGIVVMAVGLALVGTGAFLEAAAAKEAAAADEASVVFLGSAARA